ncbi:anti-sigma factor family protein [Kineococcus auxinigenes]|uniref:anti-sigma factor family protein n=1 Tax=unclassified Kineococcus TaxID=2621656 RepID=UPI003D7D47B1
MNDTAGDPFAVDAGPYVLGALAPAERDGFEEHLAGCASCRAAVEDLAGLPGLLSRVPADVVAALGEDEPAPPPPAPDTLLPRLLRAARTRRRRRRLALAGGVAAACAATAGGAVALLPTAPPAALPPASPSASAEPGEQVPGGAAVQRMEALMPVPLQATARLTEEEWGTQVDLVCAYADDEAGSAYPYALVVTDTDGNPQRIGTWQARPGHDARLSGATALTREQIAAVEVQTLQGTAVLRLDGAASGT